jgi:hypothetical protein
MAMSTQSYPIIVESGALMDLQYAIPENSAMTRPKCDAVGLVAARVAVA